MKKAINALLLSSILFITVVNFNCNKIDAAIGDPINVTFPDPKMAKAVAKIVGASDESAIFDATMASKEKLELMDYEISDITGIGYFTNLEYISINNNNVTTIPAEIGNLDKLRFLFLANNSISSIAPEIKDCTSLININIRFNNLTSVPNEIYTITSLHELNLSYNNITNISSNIENLTNLEYLDLTDTDLDTYIPEISKLSKLKYLYLASNNLTSIPSSIGNLINLECLYLDYNNLSTLPSEMEKLSNLKELSIAHNDYSNFPSVITKLSKLNILEIRFNKISKLPNDIDNLKLLRVFDISHNVITELPDSIIQVGTLNNPQYYSFNDNKIINLSKAQHEYIKGYQSVKLMAYHNQINSKALSDSTNDKDYNFKIFNTYDYEIDDNNLGIFILTNPSGIVKTIPVTHNANKTLTIDKTDISEVGEYSLRLIVPSNFIAGLYKYDYTFTFNISNKVELIVLPGITNTNDKNDIIITYALPNTGSNQLVISFGLFILTTISIVTFRKFNNYIK